MYVYIYVLLSYILYEYIYISSHVWLMQYVYIPTFLCQQHFSFYDLIVTKARGKSGPLFIFDTVSDDVRLVNDVRAEKLDAHPAKVVDRRWFERQKHIFPYSR